MSHKATLSVKHLTHTPAGRKLKPSEKVVLMQIADDHNEDRGCAWPAIPNLARRVGVTERQCQRLIRQLENDKLLESRPRLRDKDSGRTSNEYRFWFDQPFDPLTTKAVEKKIRLQTMLNAQRPVQMKLNPPDTRVTGPPTSAPPAPRHSDHHPPDMHVTGAVTPASGQELPEEPSGELSSEQSLDPKANPLPPVAQGASLDPVDQERFTSLKLQLKSDLCSISPRLAKAKGFAEIKPDQNDYDTCFVEWFLVRVERKPEGIVLFTQANDRDATKVGLKKYERRLTQAAWLRFGFGAPRPVKVVLM